MSEVDKNCLLGTIRGKVVIVTGVDKDLEERRRSERRARGALRAGSGIIGWWVKEPAIKAGRTLDR